MASLSFRDSGDGEGSKFRGPMLATY
jgi:hypothetical protein